jgi:dolichyldiphosphatase
MNALLSKILKRVINQARPAGAQQADPGMPSSHAQYASARTPAARRHC